MDKTIIIALIGGILGGGGLIVAILNFVQFLITRRDNLEKEKNSADKNQNGRLDRIEDDIDYLQKGTLRTQMLLLIADFPSRSEEIMKVAKRYFVTHNGDWYMTSIFHDYLEKNNLITPSWFNNQNHKEEE
ncbi:MAG: hypothetical protein IKP66_09830 [Lachnospiraceae bacterium]|nr:hypothetical protein [Lachnospiraceae bacterium]